MTEGPGRICAPRPVGLFSAADLETEPPVVRVAHTEAGQYPGEPRKRHRGRGRECRRRKQAWSQQLTGKNNKIG